MLTFVQNFHSSDGPSPVADCVQDRHLRNIPPAGGAGLWPWHGGGAGRAGGILSSHRPWEAHQGPGAQRCRAVDAWISHHCPIFASVSFCQVLGVWELDNRSPKFLREFSFSTVNHYPWSSGFLTKIMKTCTVLKAFGCWSPRCSCLG